MSPRPDPTLPSTPLRRWRIASGVSYAELARRVGLSYRAIRYIAAGHACSAASAKAIRRITGISLDALIGDSLPPVPRLTTPAARVLAAVEAMQRSGAIGPKATVLDTPATRIVSIARPTRRRGVTL